MSGRACFWTIPWARAMSLITWRNPLVVGGVGVASGPVNGGQGCLVEPYGGHREAALVRQVGQVGGHQGRGCRERQGAPGLGPGFEGGPGRRRWERCAGVLGRWKERVLHGDVPSSSHWSAKYQCPQVAMCSAGPLSWPCRSKPAWHWEQVPSIWPGPPPW